MVGQNHLLSLLILSVEYLFETSVAVAANTHCRPSASACGILSNISYPFRLKGDPNNCGDPRLELACQNNVASTSLNSHKYYVKAINYINHTIRLADASINSDDICSFPIHSLNAAVYPNPYYPAPTHPIHFISCPNPLKNSSLITTDCASNPRFGYVKAGSMTASEVPRTCGVDLIVKTSWIFNDPNNASLSEIHESLLYGFQLNFCGGCRELDSERFRELWLGYLWVLLFIIGLVLAGLIFTMSIIVGFALLSIFVFQLLLSTRIRADPLIPGIAGLLFFAPKFIICPFAIWFLIYKFRKRHLSTYDAIESFLQSDNKRQSDTPIPTLRR